MVPIFWWSHRGHYKRYALYVYKHTVHTVHTHKHTTRKTLSCASTLKDTERGIKQLQTQLHSREQELILERNLRRQLQKELDNKINRNNIGGGGDVENSASNFLMDDYAKPYAYF